MATRGNLLQLAQRNDLKKGPLHGAGSLAVSQIIKLFHDLMYIGLCIVVIVEV